MTFIIISTFLNRFLIFLVKIHSYSLEFLFIFLKQCKPRHLDHPLLCHSCRDLTTLLKEQIKSTEIPFYLYFHVWSNLFLSIPVIVFGNVYVTMIVFVFWETM